MCISQFLLKKMKNRRDYTYKKIDDNVKYCVDDTSAYQTIRLRLMMCQMHSEIFL